MAKDRFVTEELAKLPKDAIVNDNKLAELLGKSTKTIKRLEERGHLPVSFKLGGDKCYIVGDIIDHFYKLREEAQERKKVEIERLEGYMP